MRVVIHIAILLTPLMVLAHEPRDGDIHATIGTFTYQTHSFEGRFEPPMLVGPALTVEGDLSPRGGLEISMFFLRNSFTVRQNGRSITEGVKRIYLSTGYRFWISRIFSTALAFSSSYGMGEPFILHDDFGRGLRPPTSARDVAEYGFDVSAQYEPWRSGRFAVVMDARYGLNITPKRNEEASHFGILVGLKYFVQSREKRPDRED